MAFIVISLFLLLILALKWKEIFQFIRFKYKASLLPAYHQKPLPIFGHAFIFPKERAKFLKKFIQSMYEEQKKGKLFTCLWNGWLLTAILHHPKSAEVVLKNSKLITKGFGYKCVEPWLGTGLITANGSKWKSHRRLLTPTFHFNILKSFLVVMNEHSNKLVNVLRNQISQGTVDVARAMTMCTLDVICETAMGESVNAQKGENSEYVNAVNEISEIIMKRFRNPLLRIEVIFWIIYGRRQSKLLKVLHGYTEKVITKKMKQTQSAANPAFLDLLLLTRTESGQPLSVKDIREEVDTFMFAGHDTTATALTWIFFHLGLNMGVQDKLFEEINSVVSDPEQHFSAADFGKMPYLEQVIKESIRCKPPVPFITRQLTEDVTIDGHVLPAGTMSLISFFNLHQHPDYWERPHVFDPDRFTIENSLNRHPYVFAPFSIGPRNCIGQKFAMQELKVIVSRVVFSFIITTHEDEDVPISGEITSRPTRPLDIRLKHRTTQ